MKILIIISLLFATMAQAAVVEDAKVVKGDTLSISIKGVPQDEQTQINGNYPVNSKGGLFLPYLVKTPMAVQGLTCKAIARNIEKAYKEAKIYTTPVILVQKIREHKSGCGGCRLPIGRFLTVSGDVRRPGPQAYRPGLTLMDLVSVLHFHYSCIV